MRVTTVLTPPAGAPRRRRTLPRVLTLGAALSATLLALAGCTSAGASDGSGGSASEAAGSSSAAEPVTLRLGYFPNVTHATPIVGVEKGFFADALGDSTTLQTTLFNAGPAAIEALFSGAIDAAYIGPNPTVNGFVQSGGEAVRVISGAASGGAFLVVRDGIDTPADLVGTTVSTPQLGNTQDVALRYWLTQQGLTSDLNGGGDVAIAPQEKLRDPRRLRRGCDRRRVGTGTHRDAPGERRCARARRRARPVA